ncbi:MAG: hypothetical protein L3J11_10055 [Draconibacterium sp.]|nr:hypothetical protein [Draconibacterium sp.]
MKNIFVVNRIKSIVWIFVVLLLTSCGEYFNNPIKDKETGEDINLLIIDFNFFTSSMTFKFLDVSDGSRITKEAKVSFSGINANDIVTFTGEKKDNFFTSEGQLELTTDPNVSISENSPFEFAINVEIEGYNVFNKGFQLQTEGKKTIEINLTKINKNESNGINGEINIENGDTTVVFGLASQGTLKSVQTTEKPYKINYVIAWNDFLKLKDTNDSLIFSSPEEAQNKFDNDPDNFSSILIDTSSNYLPQVDVISKNGELVSVLFQKLETGTFIKLTVNEKIVANLNAGVITSNCEYTGTPAPDIFGFSVFSEQSWEMPVIDTVYNNLHFSYTLIQASNEMLCETGSSIVFRSNVISSFSIDADVYDMDDNFLTSVNFKGNFPDTFLVENAPSRAVILKFRDNNPGFSAINPLEITDLCAGNYEVNVSPSAGYVEYQIVLKAICQDNLSVAIAPTYSGEIKIKDSSDPWQGVDMIGGVVDLLGKPNQEYQLRLYWENAWEYSNYFTKFNSEGVYLGTPEAGATVSSKTLDDDRIQISVEKIFKQNICNDIGW